MELRRRSSSDLALRTRLLQYARDLTVSKRQSDETRNDPGPIWFYWSQGIPNAPSIVRACLRQLRRFARERAIVLLDDVNLPGTIALPDHVLSKRARMGPTHFSDVLRSALLAQQGGTWVDATVYLTAPIPPEITDLPFFAFSRESDPYVLSSWFIHAQAGHPLMQAQRDMLYAYWHENNVLVHYFLFHLLFESGITVQSDLRRAWQRVPELRYELPQQLQSRLWDPFDPDWFSELCRQTAIHKLTWKVEYHASERPATFYKVLTDGEVR